VDGVEAALGANIYSGDALNTYEGGTLRLRVGTGQLFMLASSDASMTQDHGRMDMLIQRGTAGFSATIDDPLEIETPVGTLRPANTARSFGQVTITGPNQAIITSYEGSMVLTRGAESRTIGAGESYRVSVAAKSSGAAAGSPQGGQGSGTASAKGQLVFDAIVIGGAAAAGVVLWTILCESQSTPGN
jgi:hypothetical protein